MEDVVEEPREWVEFSLERTADSSKVEWLDGVEADSTGVDSSNSLSEPFGFQLGLRADGVVSLGESVLEGDRIKEGGVLSLLSALAEFMGSPIKAKLLVSDIFGR